MTNMACVERSYGKLVESVMFIKRKKIIYVLLEIMNLCFSINNFNERTFDYNDTSTDETN